MSSCWLSRSTLGLGLSAFSRQTCSSCRGMASEGRCQVLNPPGVVTIGLRCCLPHAAHPLLAQTHIRHLCAGWAAEVRGGNMCPVAPYMHH